MPTKQITNPAGLYGLAADADPDIKEYVNGSAGTLLPGDLVVVATDVTGVIATTTTTASDVTTVGVVAARTPSNSLATAVAGDAYAVGAVMPVVIKGPARINIAANTVAGGALLGSTTAAKVAGAVASAAGLIGGFIGVALEAQSAKDANNTIRAYINKM